MKTRQIFEIQYQNYLRKYPDVYSDMTPKEILNDKQTNQKASQKTNVEVKEEENLFTIIGKNSCKSIDAYLRDGR
jgi:hypothetical protein